VLGVVFGQLIVQRVPESSLKLVIGTLLLLSGCAGSTRLMLRFGRVVAMHERGTLVPADGRRAQV